MKKLLAIGLGFQRKHAEHLVDAVEADSVEAAGGDAWIFRCRKEPSASALKAGEDFCAQNGADLVALPKVAEPDRRISEAVVDAVGAMRFLDREDVEWRYGLRTLKERLGSRGIEMFLWDPEGKLTMDEAAACGLPHWSGKAANAILIMAGKECSVSGVGLSVSFGGQPTQADIHLKFGGIHGAELAVMAANGEI